jgi:hypothetical protein
MGAHTPPEGHCFQHHATASEISGLTMSQESHLNEATSLPDDVLSAKIGPKAKPTGASGFSRFQAKATPGFFGCFATSKPRRES